jgi:hypothetical protein
VNRYWPHYSVIFIPKSICRLKCGGHNGKLVSSSIGSLVRDVDHNTILDDEVAVSAIGGNHFDSDPALTEIEIVTIAIEQIEQLSLVKRCKNFSALWVGIIGHNEMWSLLVQQYPSQGSLQESHRKFHQATDETTLL